MSLLIPAVAAGIAGVTVRKNTRMPVIGIRPQLNLIEGASIGINIADNPADDEIDIAISTKYPTRFKVLIPDDAELTAPGGETGAVVASVGGTNFGYKCLDFDPDAEEVAYWEEYLTVDYLSENIVADIYWITTDANAAHNAVFGFSVLGREKGEAWDAALGAERTVVSINGGAGVLNKARITTFSPGWSPGDVVLFKLARKAADGSDDVDQDVRVLKVVASYTAKFAQSIYPLAAPVELVVPASGSWQDMDMSSYIPAGATGVFLHVDFVGGAGSCTFGLRKKGSTDNRTDVLNTNFHWSAAIGVDENRKFQIYVGDAGQLDIWLTAYTATGFVFLDNAVDKTLGVSDAWTDMDCIAECPGAIGIIVEVINSGAKGKYGLRKKGSTDDRTTWASYRRAGWAILGCDATQVIQGWVDDHTVQQFWVIGYITEGVVFKTNADNISPTTAFVWEDVDTSAEAPSSVMALVEVYSNGQWGLRKNGSAEDIVGPPAHCFMYVSCDALHLIEGYLQSTGDRFFLLGYGTWAGA